MKKFFAEFSFCCGVLRSRAVLFLVQQFCGKGRRAKAVIYVEGGHAGHACAEHG